MKKQLGFQSAPLYNNVCFVVAFISYLRSHQHNSPLGKYVVQVSDSINV